MVKLQVDGQLRNWRKFRRKFFPSFFFCSFFFSSFLNWRKFRRKFFPLFFFSSFFFSLYLFCFFFLSFLFFRFSFFLFLFSPSVRTPCFSWYFSSDSRNLFENFYYFFRFLLSSSPSLITFLLGQRWFPT